MKYQLVIFDLDGTILDTLDDLADSTNVALQMHGFPVRTREEIRAFVGNGILNLMQKAVPTGTTEAKVKEVLADFKKYYGEHCADKTKPYDGIKELLQELRESGYQTAVVSNKADFAVQDLCEQYFKGMFDYVVGEREGVRKKPAPDSVNEVLKQLGVEKNKAVYVGDSEVDVQTAENAQMDAVIVTWGFRDEEYLKERRAKVLVDTVDELKEKFLA